MKGKKVIVSLYILPDSQSPSIAMLSNQRMLMQLKRQTDEVRQVAISY